jgi:hypothetical protein
MCLWPSMEEDDRPSRMPYSVVRFADKKEVHRVRNNVP